VATDDPPVEGGQADVPEWKPTLTGEYLSQAAEALDAAGDPDRVGPKIDPSRGGPIGAVSRALTGARYARMRYCRTSILFSALAAEAYINQYLTAKLSNSDFDAIDRMPTVDKYVLGPRAAGDGTLFRRDGRIVPQLRELFRLRSKLVHPKPGVGPTHEGPDPHESEFSAAVAGDCLLAVSAAAVVLVRKIYGPTAYATPAAELWFGRDVVREQARLAASPLPGIREDPEGDPPYVSIFKAIREQLPFRGMEDTLPTPDEKDL
jgi:hypothetical protein